MVYKWEITIPSLASDVKRRVYVSLPKEYEYDRERRFPVLYMFDGHNVFFDGDAAFGHSWGMCRYMHAHETPLIIVAIECNVVGNGRMREYSPFDHHAKSLGKIKGRGHEYMEWLVNRFKPQIDGHLRTLPGRTDTFIAGSSLGGLMALYGITAYNHVFSRAVCLSPSLWVSPEASEDMIRMAAFDPDTHIYLDYGSCELFNHADTPAALVAATAILREKGVDYTFGITPGAYHCEAAWEQKVPDFMKMLVGPSDK